MDMENVKAAFSISEFHDMAQNIDHHIVILFLLINLVRYHVNQTLLFGIKHERIFHPLLNHKRIKGTADIVCNSHFIRTLHIRGGAFRRNHDHRDIGNHMIFIHHSQYLKAVHQRHHDIQQEQVNICDKLF